MLILSLLACDPASSCEQVSNEFCVQGAFDARGVHADDAGGWLAGTALSEGRYAPGGWVVGWDEYGDEAFALELDPVTAVTAVTEEGFWVGTETGLALRILDGEVVEELTLGADPIRDMIVTDAGLLAVTETELVLPWGDSWDSSAFEPHEVAMADGLVLLGGEPKTSFDEVPAGGAAVLALNDELQVEWVYARPGQLSGLVVGDEGIFAAGSDEGDLWLERIADGDRAAGASWGEVGQEGIHDLALVEGGLGLSGWTMSADGVVPWLQWRSVSGGLQGLDELTEPELSALPGATSFGPEETVLALELGVSEAPATVVIRVD